MRSLAAALILATAVPALAEEASETTIDVPSPIPKGFLVAWKPAILSVRIDSGDGAKFSDDKLQAFRGLLRYTGTLLDEKFLIRAELEGGRFQSDQKGAQLGTDGYDVTLRLLGGTATRISQGLTLTASAGLLTRYQNGRASGGAPEIGVFGVTSNAELEYRIAPIVTLSAFVEGGLAPIPYFSQNDLGILSDTSEFKGRLQFSIDLTRTVALDIGYDFTRWHASFSRSPVLGMAADKALLIETREHAMTVGLRFIP